METKVQPAIQLKGAIDLPPDKSISHRAALFAALHEGQSVIQNYSDAADPQSTLACLEQLGVEVKKEGSTVRISGVGRDGLQDPKEPLNCGNSGTTMRLLCGILAGAGINATLVGDESLSARTMKRIMDPLREMGAHISGRDGNFAPLEIHDNGEVNPIFFELPIPSAQLKSCVLLAGLFGTESTKVVEFISSRDHTERLLDLPIEEQEGKRIISSSRSIPIPGQSYRVPNDFSAAAFWLAAGSIHPEADITLNSVGINPSRTAALEILKEMGARITVTNKRTEGAEPVADLSVSGGRLNAVSIGEKLVPNCIDEIPILAVAMLFAEGTSRISGAGELRHKETDRLAALGDLLTTAGATFKEFEDGLEIHGDPDFKPSEGRYPSFHDHRIAMAAAVLASMGSGTSTVSDSECTNISYPHFWDDLKMLTN